MRPAPPVAIAAMTSQRAAVPRSASAAAPSAIEASPSPPTSVTRISAVRNAHHSGASAERQKVPISCGSITT